MMKTPRNMMASPEYNREDMTMPITQPHIKEIGPHEHSWRDVSNDGGLAFQECDMCYTRRVLGTNATVRQDWIEGGPWDPKDNASVKENEKLISENEAANKERRKAEAEAAEELSRTKMAMLQAEMEREKTAAEQLERANAAKAKVDQDEKAKQQSKEDKQQQEVRAEAEKRDREMVQPQQVQPQQFPKR